MNRLLPAGDEKEDARLIQQQLEQYSDIDLILRYPQR